MVSIYDIVWQKCNFRKSGTGLIDRFRMEYTLDRLSEKIAFHFGFIEIEVALRLLLLNRGNISEAYNMLVPKDDSKYYQIAVSKLDKINAYDMTQLVCRYGGFVNSVRRYALEYDLVLDALEENELDSLPKDIDCCLEQLRKLENFVGAQIEGLCDFQRAYNNIISSSFTKNPVFILGDRLFLVTDEHSSKWEAITLLIAYILGIHTNEKKYQSIKKLCIYNITSGNIYSLLISDISTTTFKNISTNYVGYETDGSDDWRQYKGTNLSTFKDVLDYNRDRLPAEKINRYYLEEPKEDFRLIEVKSTCTENHLSTNMLQVLANSSKQMPVFAPGKKGRLYDYTVYYISDIHLEHHISEDAFKSKTVLRNEISTIVEKLFSAALVKQIKADINNYIVLFLGDTANTISLSRIFYSEFMKHFRLLNECRESGIVFALAGNHELSEFDTLNDGILAYQQLFNELGIITLNNDYNILSIGHFPCHIALVGGVGFARYNGKYNSSTLVGPRDLDREYEEKESLALINAQVRALNDPAALARSVIVASHYPVHDWLQEKEISSRCLYFNGHNHDNMRIVNESRNIYADGQIGYKRKRIRFKSVTIGPIYNPYADCKDGCYEVTLQSYVLFCDFCDDPIDGTFFLKQQLKNKDAHFYMIKKCGFYAFFIITASSAMICKGGKYVTLAQGNDIAYYVANFDFMVAAYINLLSPFRKAEEMIAEDIKKLGLSGRIHGSIIDIDFYNHIMINPIDGKITLYYSPEFGLVKEYKSFKDMLISIKNDNEELYADIIERYDKKVSDKEIKTLCEIGKTSISDKLINVDISRKGAYGISRDMKNIERLFTSNVLRDWDEQILQYSKEKLL